MDQPVVLVVQARSAVELSLRLVAHRATLPLEVKPPVTLLPQVLSQVQLAR